MEGKKGDNGQFVGRLTREIKLEVIKCLTRRE